MKRHSVLPAAPRATTLTLLLTIFCLCAPAFGLPPDNPRYLSHSTSNATLTKALIEAEELDKAKDYTGAVEILHDVPTSTDETIRAELARPRDPRPPLRLMAWAARVMYLGVANRRVASEELCGEPKRVANEYAAARGRQWAVYTTVLELFTTGTCERQAGGLAAVDTSFRTTLRTMDQSADNIKWTLRRAQVACAYALMQFPDVFSHQITEHVHLTNQ